MNIRAAQEILADARTRHLTLTPFTEAEPGLGEAWAYDVQALDRFVRTLGGDRVVGAKLGLTSQAKQERMGVATPIVGFLTESMRLAEGDVPTRFAHWRQPRIEPEIAFVTATDIDRRLGAGEVMSTVATAHLAAEVLDSTWDGYRFRLPDVVADNTSAAGFMLAAPSVRATDVDLARLECVVAVDGEVVHRATGASILGHPLRAIEVLAQHLERRGQVLPAGSIVLAGALTDAVPMDRGHDYHLTIEGLGALSIRP